MRVCSYIAGSSFYLVKKMQMCAMRTCYYIAECSFYLAKIMKGECRSKQGKRGFTWLDTSEPHLILCKGNIFCRDAVIICRHKRIFC